MILCQTVGNFCVCFLVGAEPKILNTSCYRTILTGMGYQEGDWNIAREKAKQINIIEPVVEGVMQLFFQTIILYIVYGPESQSKFNHFKIVFP